jgi:hypothetical protein
VTDTTDRRRPLWLSNGLFPLIRIVVLGGGLLTLMSMTEERIFASGDNHILGAAIALGMGLVAVAIYLAYPAASMNALMPSLTHRFGI